MEKNIKGSVDFEITLKDNNYEFHFTQTAENELAALMITRELLKYNKETLKASLKQASGKHLNMIKDRAGKITTAEYAITMLIESVIGEFLDHEIPQEEKVG